mmetsp:Transcript_37597/g.113569  ORF Transcript_37597/g.113569 Transcript_37597/m.113569 type:complete len:203 (-) Transcript_37597:2826-3434(-)
MLQHGLGGQHLLDLHHLLLGKRAGEPLQVILRKHVKDAEDLRIRFLLAQILLLVHLRQATEDLPEVRGVGAQQPSMLLKEQIRHALVHRLGLVLVVPQGQLGDDAWPGLHVRRAAGQLMLREAEHGRDAVVHGHLGLVVALLGSWAADELREPLEGLRRGVGEFREGRRKVDSVGRGDPNIGVLVAQAVEHRGHNDGPSLLG